MFQYDSAQAQDPLPSRSHFFTSWFEKASAAAFCEGVCSTGLTSGACTLPLWIGLPLTVAAPSVLDAGSDGAGFPHEARKVADMRSATAVPTMDFVRIWRKGYESVPDILSSFPAMQSRDSPYLRTAAAVTATATSTYGESGWCARILISSGNPGFVRRASATSPRISATSATLNAPSGKGRAADPFPLRNLARKKSRSITEPSVRAEEGIIFECAASR